MIKELSVDECMKIGNYFTSLKKTLLENNSTKWERRGIDAEKFI